MHAKCMRATYNGRMPSLQIRDLPAPVHRALAERAKREHRSIAQEATILLTTALAQPISHKERRREILAQIKANPITFDYGELGPPEEVIRRDRDR